MREQGLAQLLAISPPDLPVVKETSEEVYDNSERNFGPIQEITLSIGKKWRERQNCHSDEEKPSGSAFVNTPVLGHPIK